MWGNPEHKSKVTGAAQTSRERRCHHLSHMGAVTLQERVPHQLQDRPQTTTMVGQQHWTPPLQPGEAKKKQFCPQIPAIKPSELQLHLENTERAHLLALTCSCLVPEGKEG